MTAGGAAAERTALRIATGDTADCLAEGMIEFIKHWNSKNFFRSKSNLAARLLSA